MPTAGFNCSVGGKEIEDEDLPKYLPIVKEQDFKKAGGGYAFLRAYDRALNNSDIEAASVELHRAYALM
ncbi:hypothetical protein [Pseudomonas sp. PDM25]|uniref:hypothetical protein n=1 Tax=Pseudomonas sp. PDM25 TaxID=2854772 RepID=UPI001C4663B6|nr:hypothetical protein [Pseudomonas sp. PDM25]MBV7515906.1 hypothetical protein [Pseudomonas sp. PDM25]